MSFSCAVKLIVKVKVNAAVEFVQLSAAAAVSVKHMTPGSRRLLPVQLSRAAPVSNYRHTQ